MTDEIKPLPSFRASASKDFPEFLVVYCPREDCPGTVDDRPFLVHKRTWMRPLFYTSKMKQVRHKIHGRACPYCYRAARVPRTLGTSPD